MTINVVNGIKNYMANNSSEADNRRRIKIHVDGVALGLTRDELAYVPAAEPIEVYDCEIHSFFPPEPVIHPEEVSLDAIRDSISHEGKRTYPTFGAPTHFDQDQ